MEGGGREWVKGKGGRREGRDGEMGGGTGGDKQSEWVEGTGEGNERR